MSAQAFPSSRPGVPPQEPPHPWVLEDCSRDGDALLLAARQLQPALAALRVVALGQQRDEVVRVGGARRRLHLLRARAGPSHGDVLEDGGGEQRGLLAHQPHLDAQPLELQAAQVAPVQQHAAGRGVVEALDEAHHRALAAAAAANQRNRLAGGDGQRKVPA